uniref:Pept_C1 domain-containing protein n=1 Tax=Rhabditophanes sp. KR3021 TaxID=114890 RepID=A0AC35U9E3_9BILA
MRIIPQILLFITLVCVAIHAKLTLDQEWRKYKNEFKKDYSNSLMENNRKMYFERTLKTANAHNEKFKKGLVSFEQGLNQFSDWSMDEYKQYNDLKGGMKSLRFAGKQWKPLSNYSYPAEVDWRTKGFVTPVKNQGACGSCYIFSALGALEGMHKNASKNLVSLSEQSILDCDISFTCGGWYTYAVYDFIIKQKGVATQASYTYTGKKSACHFQATTIGAKMNGYLYTNGGDEVALKAAIASQGPISILIDVHHDSFMNYKNGIWSEPNCRTKVNHAVLAVGYGTDPKTKQDYYLCKNSWGSQWGNKGYFKMARNNGNKCGQANFPTWPTL